MTVRKLISLLQKMPQHLEVRTQDHDTDSWVLSGQVSYIYLWDKKEEKENVYSTDRLTLDAFESEPARCVVLKS